MQKHIMFLLNASLHYAASYKLKVPEFGLNLQPADPPSAPTKRVFSLFYLGVRVTAITTLLTSRSDELAHIGSIAF